jgi:hypothetical protein
LTSGSVQRYEREFGAPGRFNAFRVLLVTTTEERLQNIRRRCGQIAWDPPLAKRFIWLTTREVLLTDYLLDHAWHSLDPEDDREYRMLPRRAHSQGPIQ